jgi:putative PIN family toxin of toxin-antitoxin system
MTLRVVFDTNVLVSALLFPGGRLSALRGLWQSGKILPLMSSQTIAELATVLSYPKFRLASEDRDELLADYVPFGTVVKPWKRVPRLPECRDPFDRMFLELAVVGKARWLVTGDKDLLVLRGQVAFEIGDPASFIERVQETR